MDAGYILSVFAVLLVCGIIGTYIYTTTTIGQYPKNLIFNNKLHNYNGNTQIRKYSDFVQFVHSLMKKYNYTFIGHQLHFLMKNSEIDSKYPFHICISQHQERRFINDMCDGKIPIPEINPRKANIVHSDDDVYDINGFNKGPYFIIPHKRNGTFRIQTFPYTTNTLVIHIFVSVRYDDDNLNEYFKKNDRSEKLFPISSSNITTIKTKHSAISVNIPTDSIATSYLNWKFPKEREKINKTRF